MGSFRSSRTQSGNFGPPPGADEIDGLFNVLAQLTAAKDALNPPERIDTAAQRGFVAGFSGRPLQRGPRKRLPGRHLKALDRLMGMLLQRTASRRQPQPVPEGVRST